MKFDRQAYDRLEALRGFLFGEGCDHNRRKGNRCQVCFRRLDFGAFLKDNGWQFRRITSDLYDILDTKGNLVMKVGRYDD